MRKIVATLLLLTVMTLGVGSVVHAAVHNPKAEALCPSDKDAFASETKDCVQTCGCLFHEIEEFILEIFR